jgi:curved DNA-binding protein CbpA
MELNQAYRTLKVPRDATDEEVKQAYRELVRYNHPDNFQDLKDKADADEKMKVINEAHDQILEERHPSKPPKQQWPPKPQQQAPPTPKSRPEPAPSAEESETERIIEQNRDRFRNALNSEEMMTMCATRGWEAIRMQALRDLDRYDVDHLEQLWGCPLG